LRRLAVRDDVERAKVGRTKGVGGIKGADFAEAISGRFFDSDSAERKLAGSGGSALEGWLTGVR
jgi:hypothetical protein